MESLLQVGDVIELRQGMKVYSKIPEKFTYENSVLSTATHRRDIEIGLTYHFCSNIHSIDIAKNNLSKDILKCFRSRLGLTVSETDLLNSINQIISLSSFIPDFNETFKIDRGDFVVIKTTFSGGGCGYRLNDEYPNGHHVYCKKLIDNKYDENGIEVDFYQTGCFTAMIEPKQLELIRVMKKSKIVFED